MAKNCFQCETCGGPSERLFQSYADGSMQCGGCALEHDPFMSEEQATGIKRYLKRFAQAVKNFGHAREGAPVNAL